MNHQMFEIGEVAIAQGHTAAPELNGSEVTVISKLLWQPLLFSKQTGEFFRGGAFCYQVHWPDGHLSWQPYWMLRKRYIPPDLEALKQEQEATA